MPLGVASRTFRINKRSSISSFLSAGDPTRGDEKNAGWYIVDYKRNHLPADKNVRGATARKAYFPKRDRSVEERYTVGGRVVGKGRRRRWR